MAEITTSLIASLRAKTNCGMMDCKKALQECDGDVEKAVEILRKKGMAKAAKRSEREAKEGVVRIALNASKTEGYMLELNSETDFVSRNETFISLSDSLLALLTKTKSPDLDSFLKEKLPNGKSVEESVDELSGVIGEKIALNRVAVLVASASDVVGSYLHANQKIGVLLSLKNGKGKDELAKDLCMHVAASGPLYVSSKEVPTTDLDKEREILKEQILNEGKPAAMADKIVEGKLKKYYEDTCLVEQNFVKNPEVKVKSLLEQAGKDVQVGQFIRFSIG